MSSVHSVHSILDTSMIHSYLSERGYGKSIGQACPAADDEELAHLVRPKHRVDHHVVTISSPAFFAELVFGSFQIISNHFFINEVLPHCRVRLIKQKPDHCVSWPCSCSTAFPDSSVDINGDGIVQYEEFLRWS